MRERVHAAQAPAPAHAGSLALVAALLASVHAGVARADETRGRCLAALPDGALLVADTEGSAVVRVELDASGDRVRRVALPGGPEQLVAVAGGRVAVTLRHAGRVALLDAATLEVVGDVPVGVEPFGLARSPSADLLYVTDVQSPSLVALDARDLARRFVVPLSESDTRGLAVTPDGRRAYVVHLRAPRVSVVDLEARHVLPSLALPALSIEGRLEARPNRAFAVDLSSDGRAVWVGVDLEDPGPAVVRVECGGYGCRDAGTSPVLGGLVRLVPGSSLAPRAQPTAVLDPTDVRVDPRTGEVWVAGLGLGRNVAPDVLPAARGSLGPQHTVECVLTLPDAIVTFDAVDGRLGVLPLLRFGVCSGGAGECPPDSVPVAVPPVALARRVVELGRDEEPAVAAGRALFHRPEPGISRDGLACQTCHPDGRHDGLVWAGPRGRLQTPILAGRLAGTAPYHWHGSARTLESSIVETIGRLRGLGLSRERVALLARFVRDALPPVPRPPSDRADPLLRRGAALFLRLGCDGCHDPATGFQDGRLHRSAGPAGSGPLDVPSLRHVRLGAPFLHDGSAPDLGALLDAGSMGPTRHLRRADRAALLAFLESL